MAEQLLPDILTPVTPVALYAALRAAWPTVIGGTPQRCSLLILLAQVAEETGWKACHCWNLGNVKHVPGDGHDYVEFRASEIVGGKEVFSVMAFRAFDSLEDGAADYLRILSKRFAQAWQFVLDGDPAGFVHALKVQGYFTASEALYLHAVVGIEAELARKIPPDPLDPGPLAHDAIQQATVQLPIDIQPAPPPPDDVA